MDSDKAVINKQCDEVVQATRQIQDTIRSSSHIKVEVVLNCFWDLQDCLHRLVNTLSDDPTMLPHIDQKYPQLISDVVEVLNFTSKTLAGGIPAVKYSCQAIHELLLEIQNLRKNAALGALAQA